MSCEAGRHLAARWTVKKDCLHVGGPPGYACAVRPFRCLGTTRERGISVICARIHGGSVVFLSKRLPNRGT
jgi:hypothetical protein